MTEDPQTKPEGEEQSRPTPLGDPPEIPKLRARDLLAGLPLLPEDRLRACDDKTLELIVMHWLHVRTATPYGEVVVFGGAGDWGRDVVGYVTKGTPTPWDNYQCKQYKKKTLAPADVWVEIGKVIFAVSEGTFDAPREYLFVAPRGVGSKLLHLFKHPEQLKNGLVKNWTRHCKPYGTLKSIRKEIDAFDFSIFDVVTAETIVQDLTGTTVYAPFFGGGLTKPRPVNKTPPPTIDAKEIPYVGQLVEAYSDHSKPTTIATADQALAHGTYGPHLKRSRREFYCAESLREFGKDVLVDENAFDDLQQEFLDGIASTLAMEHDTGYHRVLATTQQAVQVEISDHPLKPDLKPADRSGICHQLANDGKVKWVP